MPSSKPPDDTLLLPLYIEALRQGQLLWFRVSSASMRPLIHAGDAVAIASITTDAPQCGEIIAFVTSEGLVVHRLLAVQEREGMPHYLQTGDGAFLPIWIERAAIVGRVIALRREKTGIPVDLQSLLAQWWGKAIAFSRYQLYLWQRSKTLALLLRACSRIACTLCCWHIFLCSYIWRRGVSES